MTAFRLPAGYTRIKVVKSFQELVAATFDDGVNALCWQRSLPGDFGEVVQRLGTREELTTLDESRLRALPVSAAGKAAIEILLEDQRLLRDLGLAPVLDCIRNYPRDLEGPVSTDVYSFHVDRAPIATDTYLCTYHGPASEGLRNDEAQQRVNFPQTRAELLKRFGGEDNADFREHLRENCYDLHYAPSAQARLFSLGVGNLWRVAVEYPGSPAPAFIHRAPPISPGQPTRLLLIS